MRKNMAANLFGLLAAVLSVLALGIVLHFQNVPAIILREPVEAVQTADNLMAAVCSGDYEKAASLMHGNPDLGVDRPASSEVGKLIWDAFVHSASYELVGECYATMDSVCQDVTFRCLDMTSIADALDLYTEALLTARVEQAENPDQIYDENNEYRETVINEVLQEAARLALAENARYMEQTLTLQLIHSDGTWWVVADQTLLNAIAGGIAE